MRETNSLVETASIKGRKIDIYIELSKGMFHAEYNGEGFEAGNLKTLREKLKRAVEAKPLNIRILKLRDSDDKLEITKGVVRGVHEGNGNYLILWEHRDHPEQHRRYSYYGEEIVRPDVDLKKLDRLWKAAQKADTEYTEFKRSCRMDIDAAIKQVRGVVDEE